MEQLPEDKKIEQKSEKFDLDLSGLTPEERRDTFTRLLGLPENATEEEMMALVSGEHEEFKKKRGQFNLEDFKKKEGPVKEDSEEEKLEKLAESLIQSKAAAAPADNRETTFAKNRPEFSPWQVERASELMVGKKYRLNNEKLGTHQDVVIDAVPYPKGSGFYVRIRDLATGMMEEKSCQDIGVAPYQEPGGELSWNPDTWVEPLE